MKMRSIFFGILFLAVNASANACPTTLEAAKSFIQSNLNPKAWERFLDILFENSNRPELLGASEHVVFVGKKV